MLYGNGRRRRHRQRELEAPRSRRAEHRRARPSARTTTSRRRSTSAARSDRTAGSSTGSSASAAAPTAQSTIPTTTPPPSLPSLTWTPDARDEPDPPRLLAEERHQPATSSSSRPTARSGRRAPFANGDFLPRRGLRRRAGLQLLRRRAPAVTLFGEPPLRRGLGHRRVAALHREHARLRPAVVGLRQLRHRPLQPRRHDQPRGRDRRTTTHALIGDLHGTADFALGGGSHAVMFGAASTDAGTTTTRQPPPRPGRSTRSTRSTPASGRSARSSTIPTGRLQAAVDLRPGPDRLPRACPRRPRRALRLDRDRRRGLGRRAAAALKDERALVQRRPALRLRQRPLALCQLLGILPAGGLRHRRRRQSPSSRPAAPSTRPASSTSRRASTLLFTAAAFDITKSNMLLPTPPTPTSSARTGEATSRGVELGAQGHLAGPDLRPRLHLPRHRGLRPATGSRACRRTRPPPGSQYAFDGALAGLEAGVGVRYVGSTVSPSDGCAAGGNDAELHPLRRDGRLPAGTTTGSRWSGGTSPTRPIR